MFSVMQHYSQTLLPAVPKLQKCGPTSTCVSTMYSDRKQTWKDGTGISIWRHEQDSPPEVHSARAYDTAPEAIQINR